MSHSVAPSRSWSARLTVPLTLLVLAAALVLAVLPPPGLTLLQARTGALALATIGLWATALIPESLTALLFFTVAMLFRLAPPEQVFSGMTSSAVWLILSGLVVGNAVRQSGLGLQIAARLGRMTGRSYRQQLTGAVLFGLVMAFLMPSAMGRMLLIMPILQALADHLGYPKQGRSTQGLLIGGVFGTFLPSFAILPANIPNNVLAGMSETVLNHPLVYSDYFLLHFPVLGLGKLLLLLGVMLFLFGRGTHAALPHEAGIAASDPGPLTPVQRRLAFVLGVALALWSTDSLHHISPAWVGMVTACLCLLPQTRFLPPRALTTTNLEPIFYVAAVIGLGTLLTSSGLGPLLAGKLLGLAGLDTAHPLRAFVSLSGVATLVGLLTSQPGVPAVLTPLVHQLMSVSGLSLDAVIAAQVLGFSTVLLPYQVPPLILAMQAGDLSRRDITRICLLSAAGTLLILWPLDLGWLWLLGVLGGS